MTASESNFSMTTRTESAASPKRKRPAAAPSEQVGGDVAEAAFGVLLDAARSSAQSRTLQETRSSPSQMFEPAQTDAKDRRLDELKESEPKPQEEPSSSTKETTERVIRELGPFSRRTAQEPPVSASGGPQASMARPPAPPASSEPGRPPAPTAAQTEIATRETPSTISADRASTPAALMPPTSNSSLPAVAPSSTAASPDSTVPNVAREIGRVLTSTRGAEPSLSYAPATAGRATGSEKTTPAGAPPREDSPEPTPTPQSENDKEVSPFERIVRSLRLQVGERVSSARLRLHPPQLGEIHVDVRIKADQIEIEVKTQTQAAREIVEQRAHDLKTALQQAGLSVRRFDVSVHVPFVDPRSPARPDREAAGNHGPSPRKPADERRPSEHGRRRIEALLAHRRPGPGLDLKA